MMKKIITLACVCMLATAPLAVFAKHDATGMDGVFADVGWRKPAAWGSWNQTQKFNYLDSIGLYPGRGNKYKGRIDSDLTDYFAHMDTVQPANWSTMTQAQRLAFVDAALAAQSAAEEEAIAAAQAAEEEAQRALEVAQEQERAAAQAALEQAQAEAAALQAAQDAAAAQAAADAAVLSTWERWRMWIFVSVAIGVLGGFMINAVRTKL